MADQEGKWEQLYEEEKAEKEQLNQEHLEAEETWKELENELEKEIDDVTAEKDRLDSDCAALREKVEAERDKKNELSTQLNRVQTELQQLKSKGSNNSSKIQKLEQENDSLSQRDRITKASLSQLKEELETVQEEKFLLNQQMLESETEMKQKLREYEEKLVEAKGDAEVKDTLVHKLQTKINVMEALGEQLAIAKADHEKDSLIQKLKAEVQDSESLRAQLAKAKGELDAKDALIQKLRDQVKEAKQKLVQVQGHLELKQSLIQSMQSQVTGSDTISEQLAKATGEIENKNLLIRKLQSQVKDVEKLREELAVAIKKTLIQKFQAGVKALGNQLTKAKRDLKAKDSLVQKLQRSLGAQLANAKGELEAKNALIKKLKDEAAHETAHEREPSGDIPLSALPDVYKDEIAASKEKTERTKLNALSPSISKRKSRRRQRRTPSVGELMLHTPSPAVVKRHYRTTSSGGATSPFSPPVRTPTSGARSSRHYRTISSGGSGSRRKTPHHRTVRSEIPSSISSPNAGMIQRRLSADSMMLSPSRVTLTVNSRVKVWWSKNQVYTGVITAWQRNRCTVTYDDGDVKSYDKQELEQRVMLARNLDR